MIRGISQEVLAKYKIDDTQDGFDFPIWDVYGRRVGKSVNNLDPEKLKYCHIIGEEFKHRGIGFLYNEQMLPTLFYGKPVIVVEGNWDCLSLIQAGLPVVAATTNQLRIPVIRKLKRYTDKLILWFDDDSHGEDGLNLTRKRLDSFQMYYRVFRTNNGKDANSILMDKPDEFEHIVNKLGELLQCLKEVKN